MLGTSAVEASRKKHSGKRQIRRPEGASDLAMRPRSGLLAGPTMLLPARFHGTLPLKKVKNRQPAAFLLTNNKS